MVNDYFAYENNINNINYKIMSIMQPLNYI